MSHRSMIEEMTLMQRIAIMNDTLPPNEVDDHPEDDDELNDEDFDEDDDEFDTEDYDDEEFEE